MRLFLGTLAAVAVSLAIPIGLLILAAFPEPGPEEGDGYVRGVLGMMLLLPPFALMLLVYHGLGAFVARAVKSKRLLVLLAFSAVASVVMSALFLWSGAPLTWDRMDDLLYFAGPLWVFLAAGSAVQYWVSFRGRALGAAEPTAAGRRGA